MNDQLNQILPDDILESVAGGEATQEDLEALKTRLEKYFENVDITDAHFKQTEKVMREKTQFDEDLAQLLARLKREYNLE